MTKSQSLLNISINNLGAQNDSNANPPGKNSKLIVSFTNSLVFKLKTNETLTTRFPLPGDLMPEGIIPVQ